MEYLKRFLEYAPEAYNAIRNADDVQGLHVTLDGQSLAFVVSKNIYFMMNTSWITISDLTALVPIQI